MEKETTTLDDAKEKFTKLMNRLHATHREHLLSFVIQEYMTVKLDDESDEGSYTADDVMEDPVALLNSIAKEIRGKISPTAVLVPSENIILPKESKISSDKKMTKHIDAFLYDEDEVDRLVKEGKFRRNYCLDCGSVNTEPLVFLSCSTSREDLYHIFNALLPPLDGKTVLDVGSGLGAVLYGAYAYTDAERIIGVEMSKEFCDVQREIVEKFKMEKRVQVINKRIEDTSDIIETADVVIFNNVELCLEKSEHVKIWQFLRTNLKSGSRLITRPDVSTTLKNLDARISIDEWLKLETQIPQSKNLSDLESNNGNEDIASYIVL